MATKINATYMGDFQVELEHEKSQSKIKTDLPVDNGGQGRTFSPTDLFTGALSSCVLTIMGKLADRDNVDLKGTRIETQKHMQSSPRKISKFSMKIIFPSHIDGNLKTKYLASIRTCPVHRSIDPNIEIEISDDIG